ncbi:MAG: hypothetical protein CL867_07595 [Cytophagaceae bacterium]|nr:hypothetical protein [Cytophagaceae bacterium]
MPRPMASSLVRKLLFLAAVVYTLGIAVGSLIPPVGLLNQPFRFMDKLLHLGAYFGLTLLWIACWVYWQWRFFDATVKKRLKRIMLITAILASCYGIIIEVLQGTMTSYRTLDHWDVLANTTGVTLAILLCSLFINKLERLKLDY